MSSEAKSTVELIYESFLKSVYLAGPLQATIRLEVIPTYKGSKKLREYRWTMSGIEGANDLIVPGIVMLEQQEIVELVSYWAQSQVNLAYHRRLRDKAQSRSAIDVLEQIINETCQITDIANDLQSYYAEWDILLLRELQGYLADARKLKKNLADMADHGVQEDEEESDPEDDGRSFI